MNRFSICIVSILLFIGLTSSVFGQTKISGTVLDDKGESLAGVNILIKGRVIGTITDLNGKFSLTVSDNPPMTMVVSFIGFRTQEISITQPNTDNVNINMTEETLLGQEVVISASRFEESIMESPVSIEKMDILAVQNTPADNYYKAIASLKGVDVATSSINFQIINTRGFGSTGNTRFVQLTDGMDTQAPALNFPIGNLNGPSELDVESLELIPGASSALYGPNAFNGILLVNSKNAFEYQGLSAFAKTGVNHIGGDADFDGPSPMWEGSIRYAKAFKNKFAFKVNATYMKAQDWHGTDGTDREIGRTPQGFSFNPGADRLHYMGDEASIPLAIFQFSRNTTNPDGTVTPGWETLAQGADGTFEPGITAWNYAQNGWLPGDVISAPSYEERKLVDYNAENLKLNAGLYYRLNDKVELSYLINYGFGTSVYTGAQRYSLSNFSITQHRLQLRGDNFYVRAYTTRENSGDSYIAEFLAKRINDIRSGGNVSNYLGAYAIYYLRSLYDQGFDFSSDNPASVTPAQKMTAHNFANQSSQNAFPLNPESQNFETIKERALRGVVPDGPSFKDATNMYHGEGQYDFKNEIDFMELQAGGSFRLYELNSNGTIFDDGASPITIKEYGAYVQAGKWLGDRKVKLLGSARYDKNENFQGRVNPRIATVFKASDNHNIRLSYQTGFRIPTTQGQHIDLNIISARLLGGLPRYAEKYNLVRTSTTNQPLSYTGESVQLFRNEFFSSGNLNAATQLLVPFTNFEKVKTEKVQNIEIGYKGIIDRNFLIDLTYYYNIYTDFITQIRVVTASESTTSPGTPNYPSLFNGTAHAINPVSGALTGNTSQIYSNFDGQITSQGAVLGLAYNFQRGYTLSGNYNWNKLNDNPSDFFSEFNTPEHKMNFSFGNRKLTEKLGFSVGWRWQTEFEWQSSFTIPANGLVPSYTTFDGQISYKIPDMKSTVKIGGSNLFNTKYIQSLGGVNIGAIYYISINFDELLR